MASGQICDMCSERMETTGKYWCFDCQQLICSNCSEVHATANPTHNTMSLDRMVKDMCSLHQKPQDEYCKQCEVYFCNTCYIDHSQSDLGCSSRPQKSKQQSKDLENMLREIDDFRSSVEGQNKTVETYTEDLKSDLVSKCKILERDFEEMVGEGKKKLRELFTEMEKMSAEQVQRWQLFLEKNRDRVKELKYSHLHVSTLMNASKQGVDIESDLKELKGKLSNLTHISTAPKEKCEFDVTYSDWWNESLQHLKNRNIATISMRVAKSFKSDKQIKLPASVKDVTSICIGGEDNHVFISDYDDRSVTRFTADGELVCKCPLSDDKTKLGLIPWDMCSISSQVLALACGTDKKIVFLDIGNDPPSLKMMKIINTNKEYISLCEVEGSIFLSDHFFHIDSFTKEGKKINTIRTRESGGGFWPRIRTDRSTGYIWGTKLDSFKIIIFNKNGEVLRSVDTDDCIIDFCVEENGLPYFCGNQRIFSMYPKKTIVDLERESENLRILAVASKLIVYFRKDGMYFIEIFNEVKPKKEQQEVVDSEVLDERFSRSSTKEEITSEQEIEQDEGSKIHTQSPQSSATEVETSEQKTQQGYEAGLETDHSISPLLLSVEEKLDMLLSLMEDILAPEGLARLTGRMGSISSTSSSGHGSMYSSQLSLISESSSQSSVDVNTPRGESEGVTGLLERLGFIGRKLQDRGRPMDRLMVRPIETPPMINPDIKKPPRHNSPHRLPPEDSNEYFLEDMRKRGSKICTTLHSRQKKHPRELTVIEGEVLEVLDDSKNWWKLRNSKGLVGHAPFTILSKVTMDLTMEMMSDI